MVKFLFFLMLIQSVATGGQVFVSQHGAKYHTHKDCQYIRKSSDVKSITLKQAQSEGKTLCSRCKAKDEKGASK